MKLRNANGGFISPASWRRQDPGHCIRAAKEKQWGVPRVKELQQRAKRSTVKPEAFPHVRFYQVRVGVIAHRAAELQSRTGPYSQGYHGRLIVWRQ